tara:strand:+ start:77 stop:433 length:357 start_codon:yes stop_codon:yes gene_type:complete
MNHKNHKKNKKKLKGGVSNTVIYTLMFIVILIFSLILYNMYNKDTSVIDDNVVNNGNVDTYSGPLNNYLINILKTNKLTDMEQLKLIKEYISTTEFNKLEIFTVGSVLYQYIGELKLN